METTMNASAQNATPQEIWAILREVAESQKDTDRRFKETDRIVQEVSEQMKETSRKMEETDRQIKETDRQMKETDRQIKETNRKFGLLSNRFGELAEHLVVPGIKEKFNAMNFEFQDVFENAQIAGVSKDRAAEVDILLESGDTVMAVEVKSKPTEEDVENHINRMEVLRLRADARGDKRAYHGAIAGAIMAKKVRDCIIRNGFYAIEQNRDTVMINVPEGFKPRQW